MISWKDYQYDLENTLSFCSDIAKLEGKSILITGSTGLIGSYLIDLLAYYNIKKANKPVSIYALSRSDKNITQRFGSLIENEWFHSVIQDITTFNDKNISVDYIINGASNAHPALYAKDPIGTITTNVFGTYNMLKFAAETDVERVLQVSTVEIYGENRGDVSSFNESYCGVLNCNNARGGYPESKRVSETLCHAFIDANDLDIVIVRPCRIYGPTMNMSDSKATAQFIKSAVAGTDITLKSAGTQQFSYAYVGDVVSAIICLSKA